MDALMWAPLRWERVYERRKREWGR